MSAIRMGSNRESQRDPSLKINWISPDWPTVSSHLIHAKDRLVQLTAGEGRAGRRDEFRGRERNDVDGSEARGAAET